jgi:hypothetical protein
MAKKEIPPAVEAVAQKKTSLDMVMDHLEKLVGEVRVLEGESRERLNDKKAMVEGILISAIVEIKKVLER